MNFFFLFFFFQKFKDISCNTFNSKNELILKFRKEKKKLHINFMNENNIFVKKKKKSIHKNNILKKRGFKMKCEMGRHTAKKTARIPKYNHHFEEPKKKSRAARTILHHSAKPSHCCDQRSMPATTPPSSPFASRSLNGHVG